MTRFFTNGLGVTAMCVLVPILAVLALIYLLYQHECTVSTVILGGAMFSVWLRGATVHSDHSGENTGNFHSLPPSLRALSARNMAAASPSTTSTVWKKKDRKLRTIMTWAAGVGAFFFVSSWVMNQQNACRRRCQHTVQNPVIALRGKHRELPQLAADRQPGQRVSVVNAV